jgi:hypothetical protein
VPRKQPLDGLPIDAVALHNQFDQGIVQEFVKRALAEC